MSVAPSAERLWTARVVHSALEEGLAKMDMAIATYGRREPISLFCYGEPGTGETTLAELFMDPLSPYRAPGAHPVRAAPLSGLAVDHPRGVLDKLGDPFPGRGTVANRMRRCRALFLRERVRLLILDELGNFIDSESGRILLAAASWLKTFMMQVAIPVVALGAGETAYRARDGRLYTTNATAVLGCSTQLSAASSCATRSDCSTRPDNTGNSPTVTWSQLPITNPAATSSPICCSSSMTAASDCAQQASRCQIWRAGCTTRLMAAYGR